MSPKDQIIEGLRQPSAAVRFQLFGQWLRWLRENGFRYTVERAGYATEWTNDSTGVLVEKSHDGWDPVWRATRGDVVTGWHERPDLAVEAL